MKNKRHILHTAIGGLLLLGVLAACNDKEMCDLPHPHPGYINLTYHWGTATAQDVQLTLAPYGTDATAPTDPAAYEDITPSAGTRLEQVAPGRYHALACTARAQHLRIDRGIATAEADGDGYLPSVDDLWAGCTTLLVESDREKQATISLQPYTRLLRITLHYGQGDPSRVQSLTGVLTGLRTSRVIDNHLARDIAAPASPAGTVALTFAPTADGTAFGTEHRLLGLDAEAAVNLTLTLRTDDGRQDTQTYNLRRTLNGLDTPSATPLEVNAEIDLTLTEAATPLFNIRDWGETENSEGDADMEL